MILLDRDGTGYYARDTRPACFPGDRFLCTKAEPALQRRCAMRLNRLLPVVLVVLFALASRADDQREPVHEGKKLSEWINSLKNDDAKPRAKAAEALGLLGSKAAKAVPHLIDGLKDADDT